MTLPPVTYLATDALDEGIGASQILAYVERLAERDVTVRLYTFEKRAPDPTVAFRLKARGVEWRPLSFGSFGGVGGVGRIARGARALRGAELVHARSDLAAASAILARADRWVWDVRSLFSDQRLELGALREGSPQHRALRFIERQAARNCTAAICLTGAVIPELERRHGTELVSRTSVITTCVDTSRYEARPLPPGPVEVLLAGTVNRYYDVPAMVALVEELRRRRPTRFVLATPEQTAWESELSPVADVRIAARPDEMPSVVARCHIGLSVCRDDAGISLRGSMPTKIGEFLATGRPIVVNPGLGDAGTMLPGRGCGVALSSSNTSAVRRAVDEIESLLEDPETPLRCRELAMEHFDLDRGVDSLLQVYRRAATA